MFMSTTRKRTLMLLRSMVPLCGLRMEVNLQETHFMSARCMETSCKSRASFT